MVENVARRGSREGSLVHEVVEKRPALLLFIVHDCTVLDNLHLDFVRQVHVLAGRRRSRVWGRSARSGDRHGGGAELLGRSSCNCESVISQSPRRRKRTQRTNLRQDQEGGGGRGGGRAPGASLWWIGWRKWSDAQASTSPYKQNERAAEGEERVNEGVRPRRLTSRRHARLLASSLCLLYSQTACHRQSVLANRPDESPSISRLHHRRFRHQGGTCGKSCYGADTTGSSRKSHCAIHQLRRCLGMTSQPCSTFACL